MKILLTLVAALFLLPSSALTQSKTSSRVPAEVIALRNEYIDATKEYIASLGKLEQSYEKSAIKAEAELVKSKELYEAGLIGPNTVPAAEREVKSTQAKVVEVQKRIESAKQQLAEIPSDAELERQYRKTVSQRKQSRQGSCRNWILTASQRQRGRTTTTTVKFVCER